MKRYYVRWKTDDVIMAEQEMSWLGMLLLRYVIVPFFRVIGEQKEELIVSDL